MNKISFTSYLYVKAIPVCTYYHCSVLTGKKYVYYPRDFLTKVELCQNQDPMKCENSNTMSVFSNPWNA